MKDDLFGGSDDPYPPGVDGPRVDIPTVETSRVTSDRIRNDPVLRAFILQVILWNAILLAGSLAVMLVYFRGDWTMGGRLLVATALLFLYSIYRWPRNLDD